MLSKEVLKNKFPNLFGTSDCEYYPNESDCFASPYFKEGQWNMSHYGLGFKRLYKRTEVQVYEYTEDNVKIVHNEQMSSADQVLALAVSVSQESWLSMKRYLEFGMYTGTDELCLFGTGFDKDTIIDKMTKAFANHWDTPNGELEMMENEYASFS